MISDNWWQKIWLFIFLIIIIYDDFDRYFTGRTPSIVIADTEILQEILVKQFNNFTDRAVIISWAALNSCTGIRKQIIYNYSIEVPESWESTARFPKFFNKTPGLLNYTRKSMKKIYLGTSVSGFFYVLVVRTVIYMFSLLMLPGRAGIFEFRFVRPFPNFVGPSWF